MRIRRWLVDCRVLPWIPQLGISFHLAIDGLSLLLVLLTAFLGIWPWPPRGAEITGARRLLPLQPDVDHWPASPASSWPLDLFLFYFFWELMLVPMYFLIGIWGHENRVYAAVKFFLFTQVSGLLMLVAILACTSSTAAPTGVYTFDYRELLGTPMASAAGDAG